MSKTVIMLMRVFQIRKLPNVIKTVTVRATMLISMMMVMALKTVWKPRWVLIRMMQIPTIPIHRA